MHGLDCLTGCAQKLAGVWAGALNAELSPFLTPGVKRSAMQAVASNACCGAPSSERMSAMTRKSSLRFACRRASSPRRWPAQPWA